MNLPRLYSRRKLVSAIRWTGGNMEDIVQFIPRAQIERHDNPVKGELWLLLDDQRIFAVVGDWIVEEEAGAVYCRVPNETFVAEYEPAGVSA